MRILHILNDGPAKLSDDIISLHSKEHDVKVIDLSANRISYGEVIDEIFSRDRVFSW